MKLRLMILWLSLKFKLKLRFNLRLRLGLNLKSRLRLRLKLRLRLCLKPRLRRALVRLQERDRKGTWGQESSLSLQMPSFISGASRSSLPDEKTTLKTRKVGSAQLVICFSCSCFFNFCATCSGLFYLDDVALYATFDPNSG